LIGLFIDLATSQVGMSISGLPEGFNPHKGIKRVFDGRRKAIETGEGVDWGFAEALAFGTLVSEGRPAEPAPGFRVMIHTGGTCTQTLTAVLVFKAFLCAKSSLGYRNIACFRDMSRANVY